ncbi:MAG: hypothetical protein J2P41_20045 [Blastocatellia bacterium]|nr:hypothetical protein [Blastocatellia bacterium]
MNTWIRFGLIAGSLAGLCAGTLIFSVAAQNAAEKGQKREQKKDGQADWKRLLQERLPVYGHRNWIVIADSAYPAQSRAGIETIATGGDQLTTVSAVLALLGKYRHIRPNVYLDAELPHVDEKYAPGIGAYRDQLKKLLGERPFQSLLHEQIIDKLDQAGEKFNVLILKTDLTLPYTSVFLELNCGYWSDEAEQQLREAMKAQK